MFLVVKNNLIICKAINVNQAKCIIKTEKAKAKKSGYSTTGYRIGDIVFDGIEDKKCGWLRHITVVNFGNNDIKTYAGQLYRRISN